MKKQITAALALLLLSVSAVSCGETASETVTPGGEEGNTPASVSAETEAPQLDRMAILSDMKELDFGGTALNIDISVDSSEWSTSSVYVMGPDKETGETVQDMVYNRNRDIADLLNVNVNWNQSSLTYSEVLPYVEKQVMSGEDTVDHYINDQFGLIKAMANGYLFNFARTELYDSHFDFTADGWYNTYMDQLSLLAGKRYFLVGDYFIDGVRASHVTYFNKKMMDEEFEGADELYKLVDSGDWTFDKYLSYINEAYRDVNGDGTQDAEDVYGVFFNKCYLYYYTSDCNTLQWSPETGASLDIEIDRGALLVDKILELCASQGRRNDPSNCSHATILEAFVNRKLLFTYWLKLADMETSGMRGMDGVGVIPYPKLDENQKEYITQVHDTAEIGASPVTVSMDKLSVVSAYLQAMTEYSAAYVMPEYYENALKIKYSQDEQSARMLNLIRAGITSPCDIAYNELLNSIITEPVTNSSSKGTNVYASTVEKRLSAAQKSFDKLIEAMKSFD